jgi:phosphoribosylglycinamide formyltransferase 1
MIIMLNVAVLGSTRGTDLEGLLQANIPGVTWSFVLSDKENAYILERARNHGLKDIFLSPKGLSREQYDQKVTELLEEHHVDLVLLIGYMRLMSSTFVQRWLNKVMNIHPSLLPAFAGGMDLNVHEAVLERGCRFTGATLMFIDEGADTGPIITQYVVPVNDGDTAESLKAKVQKAEQELLIDGVQLYRDGSLSVEGGHVHIARNNATLPCSMAD